MELDGDLDIADLDARGVLLRVGDLRRIRDLAERDIFLAAAHFADLHNPDSVEHGDRPGFLLRGGEQAVQPGAPGTPLVMEFAFATLAAELAITTYSARLLIGDALNTRHRLPRVWARVVAGEVPVRLARKVAQATALLSIEHAALVDEHMAEYADGRLTWSRFEAKLEAEVIRADPEGAARREELMARQRFAKVGQSNIHGQKTLYVKISAAEMTRIDATIGYLADALATLGDTDDLDLRRAKAVLLLANPVQALALMQALTTAHHNDSSTGPRWADDEPLPDDQPPPPDSAAEQADDDQSDDSDRQGDESAADPAPSGTGSGIATPAASMSGAATSQTSDLSGEVGDADGPLGDGPAEDTPPDPQPPDRPPDDLPGTPADPPEPGPESPNRTAPDNGSPDAAGRRDNDGDAASEATQTSLARFFEPFRPSDVPACPCRGGRWEMDWAKLLPTVTLYVHVHADAVETGKGVARWEGEGPISAQYVRDYLGPHAQFVIKPVIDPTTLAPVDAYEIPERHREALHLRTPADVFPYAPSTSRSKQVDHTRPYKTVSEGGAGGKGQTGLDNLGGMTTYHHRVKTHGAWRVEQPIPGIYLWQSPHGSVFLVDHTGTRQIRRPQAS